MMMIIILKYKPEMTEELPTGLNTRFVVIGHEK